MQKLARIAAIAIVVVVAIVVFLVSRFDTQAIGEEVVRQANAVEGVELSVQDFDLGLFSGLRLGETKAALDMPAGRVDAEVEQLVFEHELMPLLRGQVSVKQIRLDRPVLALVSREAGGATTPSSEQEPAEPAAEAGTPLEVAIQQILLRDGRITAEAEGEEGALEVEGVNVTLTDIEFDPAAASAAVGLSAKGTMQIDAVRMGGMNAGRVNGDMTIVKGVMNATATLLGGGGELRTEKFTVDASGDTLRYEMAVKGKVDPGEVLGKAVGDGFGLAEMEMTGSGVGPESKDFVGEGVIRLEDGTMPTTVLLAGMEKVLGKSSLEDSPYSATDVRFKIANNRLVLEPFQLAGERMRIDASGWFDMTGPISMKMAVGLPKDRASAGEVADQQAAAMTDEQGWTTIPLLVSGTSEDPKVGLDKAAVADAAKERAKDAAKKGLKRLFKR